MEDEDIVNGLLHEHVIAFQEHFRSVTLFEHDPRYEINLFVLRLAIWLTLVCIPNQSNA